MKFPQFLEYKFLEWQQREGGRKTVRQFAAYIGVSAASISTWWNENRVPEGDNVRKLADKFGIEVYDALGIPRPDPDLLYIQQQWESYTPEERQMLREQAEKYKIKNLTDEVQRTRQKAKPRTAN
jgi:transcriptional regulator with XRE-family HTH domain